MKRRGATTLAGILPIDKPVGMTSHDVVAFVRRRTGEGRVGHAGTLDPAATGLLVVLVGPYTRLEPYLSGTAKRYEARVAFGSETDTDDAEGQVTRSAAVPDALFDLDTARDFVHRLRGGSMQIPPAYSAIKIAGRISHREARAGRAVEIAARPVTVSEADLVALDATARTWDIALCVSKGTYVRALARDLGRACGSAAHLAGLRRTQSGRLALRDAHSLEEVGRAADEGRIETLFADPLAALGLPTVTASAVAIAAGAQLPWPSDTMPSEGTVVAVVASGCLSGIYRVRERGLVPEVVLPGGSAA